LAVSGHLFVYGTLLPDLAPESVRDLVGRLRPLGPASVPGRLYDLGPFPGVILADEAAGQVQGQVFELPDDPALLAALDRYEGFDPARPESSLFVRVGRPVAPAGGDAVPCWVYVYNGDAGAASLIEGGDYRRWLAAGQKSALSA
jgi:gamma-glutamylcyclotransferase (GGCT)/AIG2-like uncharacterized protein YtfP